MMRSSSRQRGVSWREQRGVDTTLLLGTWCRGGRGASLGFASMWCTHFYFSSSFIVSIPSKKSLVQLTQPLYFPRLTAPVHGLAAQWESKCPGWHRPGHIRNSLIVWAEASLGAEHSPRHTYISQSQHQHLQMDFPRSGTW